LAREKALIELRRGMKMMHLYMVEFDLGEWEQRDLLLFTQPWLIWKPDRDWRSALARLEASPLPWAGPLPDNAVEISEAYIRSLSTAEYYARFRQAIKEIEQQQI
jgi:hypothetical protein